MHDPTAALLSTPPASKGTFLTQLWDARTAKVLSTSLLFILVLAFLKAAHDTLLLFLFAILFAYFLAPLVGMLEVPLRGRGASILVVYLLLGSVLTSIGLIAGPRVADESRALATSLPSLLDRLGSGQLVSQLGQHYHWADSRVGQIQGFITDHREDILDYGKSAGAKLAAPAKHIWWLILIPILSLFFLKQGQGIAEGTVKQGRTEEERQVIRGLLYDVNIMLGSYIRSQIILASLTLVAYTLVLSILRVPYAFILGPLAGFLEFIPVVGPAVAAAAVIAISILAGYPHAVWLVAFLGIWRLLQDYVSAPRIMGRSLEINPLMQIFAVLSGGEIAGVIGALISVPLVATLRIVWRRIQEQPRSEMVSLDRDETSVVSNWSPGFKRSPHEVQER